MAPGDENRQMGNDVGIIAAPQRPAAKSGTSEKTVLVYRNEILSFSETFIKAQIGALKAFKPTLIGLKSTNRSLPLNTTPILLTRDQSMLSKIKRALYRHTGFAQEFYRQAEATHPSLLHAHFALDGAMALPLANKLNLPLVVTLHGYDVTQRDEFHAHTKDGTVYLRRREELWKRASTFICISEFIRQRAIDVGFPAEKLQVHYIGIDLESFAPADNQRQNNLILFVGRLVEKKGCMYLIRAMQKVKDSYPTAELVVIGDGPERHKLESLARELQVPCQFVGPQSSAVIRDTLTRARIFCAPSIVARSGDAEGLGIVFCEAQAVGTPVVSFASGGIPEAVRHEETGLLAPERNETILAECLLRYLQDDSFWQASSERGKKWVAQQFDLKQQTRKLEDIYEAVITASSPKG
jgi:glycosyltransferase involved in cell wall biosynthesis